MCIDFLTSSLNCIIHIPPRSGNQCAHACSRTFVNSKTIVNREKVVDQRSHPELALSRSIHFGFVCLFWYDFLVLIVLLAWEREGKNDSCLFHLSNDSIDVLNDNTAIFDYQRWRRRRHKILRRIGELELNWMNIEYAKEECLVFFFKLKMKMRRMIYGMIIIRRLISLISLWHICLTSTSTWTKPATLSTWENASVSSLSFPLHHQFDGIGFPIASLSLLRRDS